MPTPDPNRVIVFITGGFYLSSDDAKIRDHMQGLGHTVHVMSQLSSINSVLEVNPDAIVVSESISPFLVGTKFRDVNLPVMMMAAQLYDEMKMGTSPGIDTDETQVKILDPTHPIAAGNSAGNTTIYSSKADLGYAIPGSGAQIIASLASNNTRATAFVYNAGSQMVGVTAPARRVGFWLESDGGDRSNATGWAMFEAAVTWALFGGAGSGGGSAPPATLDVSVDSLNFGTVTVNSSSDVQTITLTHSGASGSPSLNITGIDLVGTHPGDFAATLSTPLTLNQGETATIIANFNPTNPGARSATLQIHHNAGGTSPVMVSFIGQGEAAPESKLTLSTSTLDFGTISGNSKTLPLTITHTGEPGSPSVTITGIKLNGSDRSNFSTNFSGSRTLNRGQSITVNVTFSPNSTGTKNATLTVESNAAVVNPFSVSLTGTKTASRVTNGLQLLFDFDDYNNGSTISSNGGAAGPVNMSIDNRHRVNKIGGGIEINNSVYITSSSAPTSLINNIKSSDNFTIEAWIQPQNTQQNGPAQIVSLSNGQGNRNFSVGQDGNRYLVRVRSGKNSSGTSPEIRTNANMATTGLTHLVVTYTNSDKTVRIYINGNLVHSERNQGNNGNTNLDNWNTGYRLTIGNEYNSSPSTARDWMGKIYTVAIYNRALSLDEVGQNYEAGEE